MNNECGEFDTSNLCPCGTGLSYKKCCQSWHDTQPLGSGAQTCEQLMRSRYSAYVLKKVDFLMETTCPKSREKGLRESILRSLKNTTWVDLTILRTQQGAVNDKIGKVEFIAKFSETKPSGKQVEGKLHELSRFRRYEGRWVYVDGDLY